MRIALTAFWLSTALLAGLPAHAQTATPRFKAPDSVRLAFDVEGVIGSAYSGSAELVWTQDGQRYQSQLLIRKFGLTLQTWTSEGRLSERGLEPDVFSSKRLGKAEIQARFQRASSRIVFSEGTPEAPLQSGAQDQLSVFMHLAGLLSGDKAQGDAGKTVSLQAIGDRYAEQWSFKASRPDAMPRTAGNVAAIKFTHEPTAERTQRLELWYAASPQFLPVRIRITESNGDFLDLVRATGTHP